MSIKRIAALSSILSLLCALPAKSERTSEYDQQYANCVIGIVAQTSDEESYVRSKSVLDFCACATSKHLEGYEFNRIMSACPGVRHVPESQVNALYKLNQ